MSSTLEPNGMSCSQSTREPQPSNTPGDFVLWAFLASLLVGVICVRLWVGHEVFYRDRLGFGMERPILEPYFVLIFSLPLILYPCRRVPWKLRAAGGILCLLLLATGILFLAKWIHHDGHYEIPPEWAENIWLRQAIIDPTFFPVLVLFLGCAAICEQTIRGGAARLRFTVGEVLAVTLLLGLCLAEWQFASQVLPRVLEPERFTAPAE